MKLRKWLSALFAVVMVISLLPAAALAEGEGTNDSTTPVGEEVDVNEGQEPTVPETETDETSAPETVATEPTEPADQNGIMTLDEDAGNNSSTPSDETPSADTTPGENATVYIDSNEDLVNAILNQENGQTWVFTAAGTYDAKNTSEGSAGNYLEEDFYSLPFAFPIVVDNLTITKAEGVGEVILTSSYEPDATSGGNWNNQNFITIYGTGVTIENVNLKANYNNYYSGCNKVIELYDTAKDFTLRNVDIIPLTDSDGTSSFGGSIYFNVTNVGNTTIENVNMDAWISASSVTSGNITVDNLTQDFSNSSYAGYYSEDYGYSWNPCINASQNLLTVSNYTIIVDGDTNLNGQVFNDKLLPGTTVQLSGNVTIDEMIDINVPNVTFDLNGHTITASETFGDGESASSQRQMINVTADGVTVENGKLVSGGNSHHSVNVWQADGVTLSDLKIDHTNAAGGAPVVVNGSNVTVTGNLDLTTGEHSWYGMNIDSKNGETSVDLSGASLTFSGTTTYEDLVGGYQGIVIENTANDEKDKTNSVSVNLTGTSISSDASSFYAVATGSENTANQFEIKTDDTLVDAGNGQYVVADDVVAKIGENSYISLEAALAAAAQGTSPETKTVTLVKNVELDSMLTLNVEGLTLDLGGNQISASSDFAKNADKNLNHLVDITADKITLKNGILVAGSNNNHTLNIWNADGVNLSGLTLDNSATYGGAPLIVGASNVTLSGNVNVKTGENSWYGVNVDSRNVSGASVDGKLTIADNAELSFMGVNPLGIYVENSADSARSSVEFGKDLVVSSDIPNFQLIAFADGIDVDYSCNHSYTWTGNAYGHWQICTICNQINSDTSFSGHTYGNWIVDKEATATEAGSRHHVCSVCGYEESEVIPATGETTEPGDTTDPGDTTQPGDTTNPGDTTQPGDTTNPGTTQPGQSTNTGNQTTNTTNTTAPKTSDNSMVTFAVIALAVACCGVAAILVYNKKLHSAYTGKRNADR